MTSKRTATLGAFDEGITDFDFSIGGKTVFIPSKSYFRIGLKLLKANGAPVDRNDDITFANLAPGALFNNVVFMAGGQPVSSCMSYAPQAHACSYRLSKSGAWLNSIGKDVYGFNPDFTYRNSKSSEPDADGVATVSPPQDVQQQNDTYFMYQPPIGIMNHNKPMGSGDYRFQFNPNSNYKTACVQSAGAGKIPGTNYTVEVTSMELYICTELMDVSPTGTEVLHLMEHNVQSKPLGSAGEKNFDFTLPASTKAVSIFFQSGVAGSNTQCPPSVFGCKIGANAAAGENAQNSLRSIQLTYANITKPPTRWSSQFNATVKKLNQRYFDTQIESTQAFSSGGCETLQQWLDGGVLLHYGWQKDSNDRSTQLQVQCDMSQYEDNSNIFVVSHYTREVQMEVNNGYISSVTSLSI